MSLADVEELLRFSPIIYGLAAVFMLVLGVAVVYPATERNGWKTAHPLRKLAYVAALPVFCASFGLRMQLLEWRVDQPFSLAVTMAALHGLVSGIVFVELYRDVVIRSGPRWSGRTHFFSVAIVSVGFFALIMIGILVRRELIFA